MPYTAREEFFNVLTHGLGVILGLCGTVYLSGLALKHHSALALVAAVIFGISLVLLYAASTLYHLISKEEYKPLLRLLDHISIYILIAGTYTPFMLIGIGGSIGWWGFGVIWLVALSGVVYKLFFRYKYPRLSLVFYLSMGWLVILVIEPMIDSLSLSVLLLIAAGGGCYTAGTFFYRQKSKLYYHTIWHVFVLGGSLFHYLAIFSMYRSAVL